MAAGKHRIPFSFKLPTQIPPSFQGDCGRIVYIIKAAVKGGFLESNKKDKVEFKVNIVLDLNKVNIAVHKVFILVHKLKALLTDIRKIRDSQLKHGLKTRISRLLLGSIEPAIVLVKRSFSMLKLKTRVITNRASFLRSKSFRFIDEL